MSISYFKTTEELSDEQKKAINRFTIRKQSTRQHDGLTGKQKYWCPIYKEGYLATPAHTICKRCKKSDGTWGEHEITPFDKKLGHEW